jgi:hypothetical protein
MTTSKFVPLYSFCLSAVLAMLPVYAAFASGAPPANSNTDTPALPPTIAAPIYGPEDDSGSGTPDADARPGQYFFDLGAQAAKKKNYKHAIAMYEVAASWAYKPAEYNLAVMYVRGEGTPVDLPRALAWMALAAERNEPIYVHARELIYADMTPAQFDQANAIYRQLLPTFGDAVALKRAEWRLREVRGPLPSSHTYVSSGAARVELEGITGASGRFRSSNYDVYGEYQQLWTANNPYDPKFETQPVSGTVSVGAMQNVKAPGGTQKSGNPASAASAGNP